MHPPPGDLSNPGLKPQLLHCRWILYLWAFKAGYRCDACTQIEYYSTLKRMKVSFGATWTQLGIIILSEVGQERQTNTIWYHLHVESKVWHKWIYLQNKNRLTDIENSLVIAKEGGERKRDGVSGSLGLADANYYRMNQQRGPNVRPGIISNLLDKP